MKIWLAATDAPIWDKHFIILVWKQPTCLIPCLAKTSNLQTTRQWSFTKVNPFASWSPQMNKVCVCRRRLEMSHIGTGISVLLVIFGRYYTKIFSKLSYSSSSKHLWGSRTYMKVWKSDLVTEFRHTFDPPNMKGTHAVWSHSKGSLESMNSFFCTDSL